MKVHPVQGLDMGNKRMRTPGKKKFNILMTALITLTMVGTLALPLQVETAQAASGVPRFSNKPVIKAKLTPIKKNKKTMNLRLEVRQKVTGYDTIQGSCYGGGYMYFLMWCRANDKCRILKIKKSNLKVVKISKVLSMNHGNDMTYNSRTGKLVVANSRPYGKKLTVINSKTLTIEKRLTVELPENVPGIRWNRIKSKGGYNGFNNIGYNAAHDQYVVQLYNTRDFLFLDSKFKPVRYVTPTNWDRQVYQGMDSFGDRIVVCNSYASGKPDNVLSVYDWDGKYLSRVKLARGMELESVFHQGNQLYVSFYKAYTARYLWKTKVKKTRKKGKIRVYVKKRKSGLKFLNRDGYVYRVTNL